MNTFDWDAYLKLRDENNAKLSALADASKEKQQRLQEISSIPGQQPESDKSWSTQLGLTPESFGGGLVNTAASLVSGTARLGGHIASLPSAIRAAIASIA